MERESIGVNIYDFDFLSIGISREEIEEGDISGPLSVLKQLLNKEAAVKFFERVDIAVQGYDDDQRELFEIPAVREFINKLDAEFPFWFYFLTKRGHGLQFILWCILPPLLTPAARRTISPKHLEDYLMKRGLPAMNQICALAGCSEQEIERLTNRVMTYIVKGPDRTEP